MSEKLTPRAITPMAQHLEAGCVPTAISMVFSGFGVNLSEQTLVDKYFQTVRLPATDRARGVSNRDTITGILKVIEDHGLKEILQLDVFDPHLYRYTSSPEDKFIVRANPKALRKYGEEFKKVSHDIREFYTTLEELLRNNEIGVYTANSRMLGIKNDFRSLSLMPDHIRRGFYTELSDFVGKGHIIGPHGGMTMHTRALDGSRMKKISWIPDEQSFVIVDPRGESYPTTISSLVWVDSSGVRGDVFDYLFRVSPKEESLNPQNYGFRRLLQNLRSLIP